MRYHNITKDDMLNGDGLRAVLWTAGCPHRCPGCHNPVTWDENGGLEFDSIAKDELFSILDKPYISGLTLSGGDPLLPSNRIELTELIKEVNEKFPDKTIWLYTGYLWKEVKDLELIKYIDVLVDGRFLENLKNTQFKWRGSSNQRVIDVKKTLENGNVVLYCD